ncbi:DUF3365 domain-containing protein [Piscinibacter sp. XHJ-5]|uniref:Tll0287-like domain-containing protein n=1 Tax=Piscinibacter sp. XHJ-5 TaxID=3037797 RepID=UPI00245294DF|nr:DUF3365 domain-containing protein [Piscinibacter sp. XHJ-5]
MERMTKTRTRIPLWVGVVASAMSLGAAGWWTARDLVLSQGLNEGRTVADFAESVGRWASQYGGIHVRTEGVQARMPGSFLTRATYAVNGSDADVLQGSRIDAGGGERTALARVEAYHWKNPALIQREVADAIAESGSRARYRLTAATVLNPSNAPNPMEQEALNVLKTGVLKEYWQVRGGELFYARAVVAKTSCLKCHDSPQKAPEYLRRNAQFNGGGGFGYEDGKPAGLISVTLPLPNPWVAARSSLSTQAWAALLVAGGCLAWVAWGATQRRRP